MTALNPELREASAAAPSPKWTAERIAFITEQYLTFRKSAGEIAQMLGPAFTRNSVTGKLFRTGVLQARSGIALSKDHGLPKGESFCAPRSRLPLRPKRRAAEELPPPPKKVIEAPPQEAPDGLDFVKKTEALFEIGGIALLEAKPCQCRWPARPMDGAAHICGAPRQRGAYCARHAAIAYQGAARSARAPRPANELS